MNNISVYVKKINEEIELPFYANIGDAGMDIRANENITIAPGETKIVKTGLMMAVDKGIEIQVRPRSGLSAKTNLRIANSPGTIDSGYRGEIGIIIHNTSKDYYWDENDNIHKIQDIPENHFSISEKGNKNGYYDIKKGDRIAQIVFCEILNAMLKETEDIENIGENRKGGFGSTGLK